MTQSSHRSVSRWPHSRRHERANIHPIAHPHAVPNPDCAGKDHSNPIADPAQFNEFYRQCSRRPTSNSRNLSPASTPDRMLFIIGTYPFELGRPFVDVTAISGMLVNGRFSSRVVRQFSALATL